MLVDVVEDTASDDERLGGVAATTAADNDITGTAIAQSHADRHTLLLRYATAYKHNPTCFHLQLHFSCMAK